MPPPRYPIARKQISDALPVSRGARIAAGAALPAHLAFLRQRGAPAPASAGPGKGPVLSLGDARLDACLPHGGLPLGALHEAASAGVGAETGVLPAAFAALLAGRIPGRRPVLWVARRDDLYAPGLPHLGPGVLDPARLVLAHAYTDAAVLGVMETALRAGSLAAVIGEVGGWGQAGGRIATRRLQLACQVKGITAFALRRWPFGGAAEDREASAASTRWHLAPAPSANGGAARWRLELRHARGGRPGAWMVEVNDDATDTATNDTAAPVVRVVAALADHAAAPGADFRQAAGYG